MKKYILPIAVSLLMSAGLASCYSDDSTTGDPSKVGSIDIAEMAPQSVTSYAGKYLQISPDITSTYAADDLEYAWYLYQEKTDQENGFRNNCISKERNLNYEVNLKSGTYTVALEVTSKSTGLKQLAKTSVLASTEFSNAFFILKETADGNTELDMVGSGDISENLITTLSGAPMQGKPSNLAMIYGQNCADPDTYEAIATNTINVFTDKEYRSYRTEDMVQMFDSKSITYAGDENEQKFTNIAITYWYAFLISDKGCACKFWGEDMGVTVGKFGLPAVEGNFSKHIQAMGYGRNGAALWDIDEHGIYSIDYNCSYSTELYTDATKDQECIASGVNKAGSTLTVWFLCENKSDGKRFLHLLDGAKGKYLETKALPSDLHISKASCVGACGGSAAVIYSVDGGKLYSYAWGTEVETEVALPGVSGNVSFVTNQWYYNAFGSDNNFDNLIVGTQDGNKYTLYFFDNLVGGVPNANPAKAVSGTGKVKSIRRATPDALSSYAVYYASSGPTTAFPTAD